MPEPADEHRKQGAGRYGVARPLRVALVTVSSSRTAQDDRSGDVMASLVTAAGHAVAERRIVTDETAAIRAVAGELLERDAVDAVVLSGGTGISPSDVTIEAIAPLFSKPLAAFSALFAQLSYEQVGAAAMLSRAAAGLAGRKVIFCLPGSPQAVRLAMETLILPELGHLLGQARRVR